MDLFEHGDRVTASAYVTSYVWLRKQAKGVPARIAALGILAEDYRTEAMAEGGISTERWNEAASDLKDYAIRQGQDGDEYEEAKIETKEQS